MPNIKSAKKELRKNVKRHARNKQVVKEIKMLSKNSLKAIEAGKRDDAEKIVKSAMKAIDKAAQKGIIKENTKNRKKSKLHRRLNQMK